MLDPGLRRDDGLYGLKNTSDQLGLIRPAWMALTQYYLSTLPNEPPDKPESKLPGYCIFYLLLRIIRISIHGKSVFYRI
jgi:hypothetical protein